METSKLNREQWIDAAQSLLLEGGIGAVSIQSVAKMMGTSRTSFYWLFKDRSALLNALLARWDEHNTRGLIKQAEKYAANISEAILNVHDCWFDAEIFDSDLERAFLSWSQQDEDVAAVAQQNDEKRVKALEEMYKRYGYSALDAHVRARTVYYMQIGYIVGRIHEPSELRLSRVAYYAFVFTGQPCTRADLERFIARHGMYFAPSDINDVAELSNAQEKDHVFMVEE